MIHSARVHSPGPLQREAPVISRRIAAIGAVSALVLVSIAAGTNVAFAAPNPPTVDQTFPDPWITQSTQPAVQGNMDLGAVQIDVEASSDGITYAPYCTVPTSPAATVWFCPTPTGTLTRDTNFIRAIATDSVPESSAPGTPISITVVDGPRVDSPADDLYTNDYQPTFTGTSDGSYFDVYSTDFATHFCGGTVVNLSWNCTSGTLPDGDYTYLAQSTYGATTLFSPARTLHIDTLAPAAPSIDPVSSPVNSSPGIAVSGLAEENATLDLLVDGSSVTCNTGPIDYTGYWSCSLPDGLPAGAHTLTAFQTDLAGNVSALSTPAPFSVTDNTPPAPPVVTSPIGNVFGGANSVVTNDTNPTITGTGEPGATINILGNACMIVPTIVDGAGNWTCALTTPMTPDGDYDVHFGQTDAALNASALMSPYLHFTVDTVIPDAPDLWTPTGTVVGSVIHATTANPHPVITGTGEYGATVQILRGGSMPVPCVEGSPFVGEGGFTCTVASTLAPGVYNFSFGQTDEAGNSGTPVNLLRLTVLAPPAATPPTQTPTLAFWLLQFSADNDKPAPGQNVTLTGSGLPPGSTVNGELHSDPLPLGTTKVGDDGTFTLNTHIPNTVEPGAHHYVVTVTPLEGEPQTSEIPVTVTTAQETAITPPAAVNDGTLTPIGSGASGAGATVDRDDPVAPNTLSATLPSIQDVLGNPIVLAAAAGSSLALLFLVALPAELLNSTLDENYERLFGRIRRPKLPWLERVRNRLRRTPVVGGLALTTLAALILSFSDPSFGFDLTSLRLFLACMVGMFVLGYVANIITGAVLRKRWSITSVIELQPFGLLVALLGVVLSRLLDFAPGLLIGLVLTLSLSASAKLRDEARYVLTWAGTVLGISILGWLAYSFFSGVVAPDTFGGALVDDTFVAIATEGISALVIGLLPLGFLDGRSLFRFSRLQWLGTYLVALAAFFTIVVPSGALWGDIRGPFWIWLAVVLTFAALCVGTYLWFRAHPETEDAEADAGGAPVERETVSV